MSYSHVVKADGPWWLVEDEQVGVGIAFNGGRTDMGAQWIMAHPIGPGTLVVGEFTKEKRLNNPGEPLTFYYATVTNVGWAFPVAEFSIQGGGNV
jgi:hypothetical protein